MGRAWDRDILAITEQSQEILGKGGSWLTETSFA